MGRDRLTAFGLKCREFRTRYDLVMADQAKGLGVSVAYISAIERGKRSIPDEYPAELAHWLSLSEADSKILSDLAAGSKRTVRIQPKTTEQALLAHQFARDVGDLPSEALKFLRSCLTLARSTNYSDQEICARALLVRLIFDLDSKAQFNLLKLVENQLPLIDPAFSLQVESLASNEVHIFSDSDGKATKRFVTSEWLYEAADRQTPETRFQLAHEIAHWMLHRQQSHTFFRLSKRTKILSKNVIVEREADRFAQELLMPLHLVDQSTSASSLAKMAGVPIWAAYQRLRYVEKLKEKDREEINRTQQFLVKMVRSDKEVATTDIVVPPVAERPAGRILHFPSSRLIARSVNSKKHGNRKKEVSPTLFDYADTKEASLQSLQNRGDTWFSTFGYRG